MRNLLAVPAAVLLSSFAPLSLYTDPPSPRRSFIAYTPVPLDLDRPSVRRVGKLTFLGGWILRSNDWRFGGISGLAVSGRSATAVSDRGRVLRFSLPQDGRRTPLALFPLRDGFGPPVKEEDRDSESLLIHGGTAWIGFENHQAVWRYATVSWSGLGGARPAAMRKWPVNGGPEAMVRLGDGRFLVFSESERVGEGMREVLMFAGDPSLEGTPVTRLRYRPPAGYRATDAALLADGRMLVLNRRFAMSEGVSAVIVAVTLPRLVEGATLVGAEVARLASPLTVDNFEALSVQQEGGRTILWIASDDNFMPLQRTLLMKFALDGAAKGG